jgi:hypothetical protein
MATEQVPTCVPGPAPVTAPQLQPQLQLQPLQAWLARLGLSGKILLIGGLIGVIAVFLPLLSMSMQMPSLGGAGGKGAVNLPGLSTSHSVMVVRDWRGTICLVGYLAALALAFVLYPPNGLGQKALGWAGVAVGGLIALLALWLLILAFNGSAGMAGFGLKISVGIGAILNLLAAATVAAGGLLKAREEKLF